MKVFELPNRECDTTSHEIFSKQLEGRTFHGVPIITIFDHSRISALSPKDNVWFCFGDLNFFSTQ